MNRPFPGRLFIVRLLPAKPVDYCNERESDTNPIKGWANWVDDILESPLKKIGNRSQYALQIHG
jgi:hypothetical protein